MHECKCSRGYTGPQCTTQVSERKTLGLSYILGPMAAVLTVLTILGCVLLAFCASRKTCPPWSLQSQPPGTKRCSNADELHGQAAP
ncbi:hypothetical protein COOONC_26256 [Cooperia oncophora]